MANLLEKIVAAKEALVTALGEDWQRYLSHMKLWFHHKWTKEEFDTECRRFLTADKIHLHNQFLIAILNKVEPFSLPKTSPIHQESTLSTLHMMAGSGGGNASGSSNNKKRRRAARSYYERYNFEPFDYWNFLTEDSMQPILPPSGNEQFSTQQNVPTQRYCAQELFLPDAGFLLGRFLIGAWEIGLKSVEDEVAEYVALAAQMFVKNLISTLILKRKCYRTTHNGNFYYDVGASYRDITLRNSVTRQKLDDSPLELDKEITSASFIRRTNEDNIFLSACEDISSNQRIVITLKDCQKTFRDRNLIPSHSLYVINMERINMMLH